MPEVTSSFVGKPGLGVSESLPQSRPPCGELVSQVLYTCDLARFPAVWQLLSTCFLFHFTSEKADGLEGQSPGVSGRARIQAQAAQLPSPGPSP